MSGSINYLAQPEEEEEANGTDSKKTEQISDFFSQHFWGKCPYKKQCILCPDKKRHHQPILHKSQGNNNEIECHEGEFEDQFEGDDENPNAARSAKAQGAMSPKKTQ